MRAHRDRPMGAANSYTAFSAIGKGTIYGRENQPLFLPYAVWYGLDMAQKRRPPQPPPRQSARLYVRIAPAHVGMFRFLLEAEDNLAYATTVDRWASVLRVTFSPHQRCETLRCLEAMRTRIPFALILDPDAGGPEDGPQGAEHGAAPRETIVDIVPAVALEERKR